VETVGGHRESVFDWFRTVYGDVHRDAVTQLASPSDDVRMHAAFSTVRRPRADRLRPNPALGTEDETS